MIVDWTVREKKRKKPYRFVYTYVYMPNFVKI